ncbi:aminopeptidase [Candidatus Woesearchaeota archaeon]|nr:aminopeptidase [Candidatus Woesearchaeota archaeon]
MGTVEYGVKQLTENCLGIQPFERVVLVYDQERTWLADEVTKALVERRATVEAFEMENYGDRPEILSQGQSALKFPREIEEALNKASVSIYFASSKVGEYASFRKPMIGTILPLTQARKLRHAHMPDLTKTIMEQGMNADYTDIERLNAQLMGIAPQARTGRVVTTAGTNYRVDFIPEKYHWYNCNGDLRSGSTVRFTNLPDGEVFGYALNANGVVVVDGVLGDEFSRKYGDINDTPVSLEIKNSRVIIDSIRCTNPTLVAELKEYMQRDENANRVGEWAIGTNLALLDYPFSGELLQDEKYPGHHFAVGEPCSDETGAEWTSCVHLDMVLRNPTITLDQKVVMEAGRFLI